MSPVTHLRARAALLRFIDSHFMKDGKTHARFTIPPRDDDDDALLSRFISESEARGAQVAAVISELDAARTETAAKIAEVEHQRDVRERERDDLAAKLAESEAERLDLRERADFKEKERDEARAKLATMTSERDAVEERVVEVTRERNILRDRVAYRDQEIVDLTAKLADESKQHEATKTFCREWDDRCTLAHKHLDAAGIPPQSIDERAALAACLLGEVRAELAEIRDVSPSAAELLDLRASLAAVNRANDATLAALLDRDAEVKELTGERDALRKDRDSMLDCKHDGPHCAIADRDVTCQSHWRKAVAARVNEPAEPASDRRARAVALMGRAVREGGGLLFIEEAFHLLVPDEPPRPTLDLTELRTALHAARASAHYGASSQSVQSALDHVYAAVERLAGTR